MIDFKYFERFGLREEDFKIDIYKVNLSDAECKSGVEVGIPQIDISVKCHSEKSRLKNKTKCLEMLKLIVDEMMYH